MSVVGRNTLDCKSKLISGDVDHLYIWALRHWEKLTLRVKLKGWLVAMHSRHVTPSMVWVRECDGSLHDDIYHSCTLSCSYHDCYRRGEILQGKPLALPALCPGVLAYARPSVQNLS